MRSGRRLWHGIALWAFALLAVGTAAVASDFSATVTLTTDYVYRGVSQTAGEPAVQGGFDYSHGSGFFAGIWGSNVDFETVPPREEPRDLEVDLYLGYHRELGRDWSIEGTLIRYMYPGSDSDFHYDYNELLVDVSFRELVTATVGYTDDFSADASALTWGLSGSYPVSSRFEVGAGVGLFDLDELIGDSYAFWNVGVSAFVGQFSFDLSYFDTDSTAELFFGDAAGDRVVLSVTAAIR